MSVKQCVEFKFKNCNMGNACNLLAEIDMSFTNRLIFGAYIIEVKIHTDLLRLIDKKTPIQNSK